MNTEKPRPQPRRKMIFTKRLSSVFSILVLAAAVAAQAAAQTGGIKGKVRTMRGDGIASATVTARKSGTDVKSVRSDRKGNFVINGLEPGSYNVVFDAAGYSAGVLYNVEVKTNSTRNLADRLMLSADPGTQVIIKGSVFYREGISITGAKVEIERLNADGSARNIATTLTSASGEFTFRQPEGNAKFRITAKFKGVSAMKEVEVSNAAIYRLALTLDLPRSER